ncbi:hypothetical protein BH09VER1_BH09VER1_16090 [soil metagenome]
MPERPPESDKERIDRHLKLFLEALKNYESEHPHWQKECLFWVMQWGLTELKRCLDGNKAAGVTWENPIVELHFPVPCSWETIDGREALTLQAGKITAENVRDEKTASKTLAQLLIRQVEIMALQTMTNFAMFEKTGENHVPVLGEEPAHWVDTFEDKEEQEAALRHLFEPQSFGAGSFGVDKVKEGESLSAEAMEEFSAMWENVMPPLVSIPTTVHGRKISVAAILQIHPMIADLDTKTAYFPIIVGLAIQAIEEDFVSLDWLDGPWASFQKWSPDELERTWLQIFEALDNAAKELRPEPSPEVVEAVITVNASMVVQLRGRGVDARREVTNQVLQHLQGLGQVTSFDSDFQLSIAGPRAESLRAALLVVETAQSSEDKGKALEALIADLFSTIPGFSIQKGTRTKTEEIDLVVQNNCTDGALAREEDIILVECKNWSDRCGKNEFALLLQKMQNRFDRCSLGFLVSWGGFCNTITLEMLRGSRGRHLIVPLDASQIRLAVETGDFLTVIVDARTKAVMV